MLLSLLACMPIHTGQVVSAVQLVPSSVPIAPGSYRVGPEVSAERCDYVDDHFTVASLVYEATGRYDGLINVVIEQFDEIRYRRSPNGPTPIHVERVHSRCFRVSGYPVTLVPQ